MRLARASIFLLFCALAAPAAAQEADPIGALLQQQPTTANDEDAAERAGRPLAAPEPEPDLVPANPAADLASAGLPTAPIPYTASPYAPLPARPQLTEPVHIDEVGKTPDAPPRVQDLAYESRLRSSFASAQGFQGPLDGSWTLSTTGDGDLYALELRDKARGEVEGAWRDLRRRGALGGSGFVDDIQRIGGGLTLRFTPGTGAPSAVATLQGGYGGLWTGELEEGGRRRAVTLRRNP
jgi:hypothetical protein